MGSGYLFTAPIREAMEFEKAMVRVKAMSGATGEEFKRLKAEAKRLGTETIYTSLEVAQAQNELATAGYRTDEIISIMPGMLDLANSSMTGLARTAEITSEVMQGFNLDVTEMQRVGDALTAAYTGSSSSLDSLGEMLKYVAAVAVDVRSSLEQTLAASSVLHNNGIKGSMAGTGMRALFERLADPPAKLKKMLRDMKVDVKDTAGNMRNWIDILHDINKALEGTGTAVQASAWKKLAGEDHAPTASKLAAAEKSGALQLEEKKYRMAPAFNALGKSLLAMPDAQVQEIGQSLQVKFNRAMSGGGLVASLASSLHGLNGKAYEDKLQEIFRKVKIAPSIADINANEYQNRGKKTEDALRRLHINPLKSAGGEKGNLELTREIKAQLQTLPMQEQLEYVELFFSKTRTGVASLLKELAPGGKKASQLVEGLNDTLNMDKTRTELSKSAAHDLDQIQGALNSMVVSLGESLLPLLREFAQVVKPIAESFAKWISEHQGVAKAIMLSVGALFAFSMAMAGLKLAFSGLASLVSTGTTLKGWFDKDRIAGKGARKLWKGAAWLGGKGWKSTRWAGKGLAKHGLNLLKKGGKGAWGALWKGGELAASGFGRLIAAGPRLMSSLGAVMNVVRALGVAMLATPIGLVITTLVVGGLLIWRNWSTVGPWLMKMWSGLKTFFVGLWMSITSTMKIAWDWIKENLSWHPVTYIARNWEKLVGMFRLVYEKIKPYIRMLFPFDDSGGIKIAGPDEPGFLSRMIDSGKDAFSGLFSEGPKFDVETPAMPNTARMAESGSYTQRNVITVHANITVESGPVAPLKVAQGIKREIQTAFRNVPSFDLFDSGVVS